MGEISVRLGCVLLLLVLSASTFAQQSDAPSGVNQDEFVFALIKAARNDQRSAAALLTSREELISERLWHGLIQAAEYDPVAAPSLLELSLQVARRLQNDRLIGSTYYQIGWHEFGQGNISVAIQNYLQSKHAFETAGAKRDLIYVFADLSTLYIYASDYQSAREYSEKSLAIAEQVRSSTEPPGAWPDERGVSRALANLGNIARRDGECEKAIGYFQKSLAAYRTLDVDTGRYNSEIVDDLADIGRTYVAMGDYVRGLSYLNQSMTMAKRAEDLTRAAGICNSLGILYLSQRDYGKAIDFFQQGLQLASSINDRFKQADMLLNLGVAYQFQGDFSRALPSFEKALEVARQIDYQEIRIVAGEGIGGIYKEQSRYDEGLEYLRDSLTLARRLADKTRIAELL